MLHLFTEYTKLCPNVSELELSVYSRFYPSLAPCPQDAGRCYESFNHAITHLLAYGDLHRNGEASPDALGIGPWTLGALPY